MPVSRVSTYALHNTTLLNTNRVQASLGSLQNQISSGNKASNFAGLNGSVEQFTGLDAKMRKSKLYQENNSTVISRLQNMGVSMEQIITTANDIENLIVLRRDPTFRDSASFAQQIEQKRALLASQLNVSAEGRFLFGGTRTDIKPVMDDPFPPPVETGVPDDSYYQGSHDDITVRAQDNLEIKYNIRADDEAFQNLFAGIALALDANAGNDDVKLQRAEQLIQQGKEGAIAQQTRVNANVINIQEINDRHSALELYWKGVSESISKTDLIAASTEVSIDQAVLSAAFQSFARISQLRLSDYLQ